MQSVRNIFLSFSIVLLTFSQSCQTVEQKKEKCKNVVNELAQSISLSDWQSIKKVYPKAPGYVFVFDKINLDSYNFDGDTAIVYATGIKNEGQKNEYSQKIRFFIVTEGKPEIVESNGLSYYYDGAHHKILQTKGCLRGHMNDYILDSLVERTKLFFDSKIKLIASIREQEFNRNIEYNNGIVPDGRVYITNKSNYNFNLGQVNCKTVFYNAQDEEVGSEQHMILSALRSGGTDNFMLYPLPSNSTYSKTFVTISEKAIEEEVKENPSDFGFYFNSICEN